MPVPIAPSASTPAPPSSHGSARRRPVYASGAATASDWPRVTTTSRTTGSRPRRGKIADQVLAGGDLGAVSDGAGWPSTRDVRVGVRRDPC